MSNESILEYKPRSIEKFVVRLPSGMRDQIADVARTNFRSSNSEIIQRLADSLALDQQAQRAADNVEGLSLDERVLLSRFRMMGTKQKSALVQLIAPEPGGQVAALAS